MIPGERAERAGQEAAAARDVFIAGRDQIIVNVGAAGMAEPVVPRMLPRDVPAFTGREGELDKLTGLARAGSVVVAAIGGTAGVGKTALAVHAAYRMLPEFPDGHLYADLRGYTEGQASAMPGEVLEVFLRHLGVPAEEVPVGTEERSGLLRQLLTPRRLLILLDNAAAEAQVRPLLPGAGRSLVLITSRSMLPGLEVDARIGLGVLAEEEAAELLTGLIGAERAGAAPQAVAQVAGWCGRLPLALRIAGQLLAVYQTWPVAKLAQLLADERDRLEQLTAGDLQVRAAFAVSYAQLTDGDARLFRLLGRHPDPDFDVAAAASLAGIEEEAARPVLHRLVEAHLVTKEATGRFGMHDLLLLFARTTCQETDDQAARDAAEARLVGHYTDRAGFLNSCIDPRQRPAAEQAGVPLPSMREALELFEAERPRLLAAVRLAAQRGWDEHVSHLSASMGSSLTLLRHLDDLLTVQEAALAASRRAGDTPAEGRALGNLGNAYQELRRFEEAIGCYQESLAIFREIGDQHGEGAALNNLGLVYRELRRREEAIACYQQDIAICQKTGDRHGEGLTLGNLGTAYHELRRFEDAIDCYEESLAICEETGDLYGAATALGNLGSAYQELRRFEDAIGYYQESLAVCRETGDPRGECRTLNNLGLVYRELRRFEDAIGCYNESLTICRETGDPHGAVTALGNIGSAYQELRQFEEAIACFKELRMTCRETGDRRREAEALVNLGIVYWKLQQPDRTAACLRDAAAAMRDTGDREAIARLEYLAANAPPRQRRWRRSS